MTVFRSAGCFLPNSEKSSGHYAKNNNQFFYQSCQTPIGSIRAISDSAHLIQLDWNQISWKDADRPDDVSRETITQLTAYFAGQLTAFTIPLRPAGVSPARQHWLDVMASIDFGTTISYAAFAAAAGAPKAARAAGTDCGTNPIPIICPCHRVVRRNGTLGHYGGSSQLSPSHKDNVARKAFLIAHEKRQLNNGQLILT
jgi:methylated-DNA-[protein]-cysteine S-methyltransferase